MDQFLRVLEHWVQIGALTFLATAYVIKVVWLFRFPAMQERTPSKGSKKKGITYSYLTIANPLALHSTTKQFHKYVEFALFHIGITLAITATFIIPYAPEFFESASMVTVFQIGIALGLLAGVIRMVRRAVNKAMRIMSSLDDWFSIILLNLYLVSALIAVPNDNYWALVVFFGMTTFFLIAVPFTKISHYLLWPFNRYYIGRHFGHRGVYPKVKETY